ncbi:MAG: SpoIIE family protein phosphatase [Crocinitomicaceae bacterium]
MIRCFIINLLCTGMVFCSVAQQDIQSILKKADAVYDNHPEESFALCERAERQADKSGNTTFNGDISLCKARYYLLIARYDAAGSELNKAILIFRHKKDLLNLSNAYSLKSILLDRIGEPKKAHNSLLKSLELSREAKDTAAIASKLLNLTLDYKQSGQADSMLYCLNTLEDIIGGAAPTSHYFLYQNWALYYLLIDQPKQALQQLQTALDLAVKYKMTDSKATCLTLLSIASRRNGEYENAEIYAREAYEFSEENNLIYESNEALNEWIAIKELKGDYKGAFELQKKWIHVDRQIYDLEKIQKVKAIESQLEIVEKEKEIAEGEIALQKSNLKGQKARTRNAWLSAIILLVVVLLVYTVFVYKKTKRLNKTIQDQKEQVEDKSMRLEGAILSIQESLEYSKLIQHSMLPSSSRFEEAFDDHFIFYKPKDIVSGDFYWIYQDEKKVIVAVGDCTGHGVPGAMVSMVCHEALNKVIIEQGVDEPAAILNKVRDVVANTFKKNGQDLNDGMDIALCKVEGSKLSFAGAYNPFWLFRNKTPQIEENTTTVVSQINNHWLIELKADKQPIGKYYNPAPFHQQTIQLEEGDTFYLFSDGYADQFGGDKGKKLKAANLKKILAKAQPLNMNEQCIHLDNLFNNWKGDLEQLDDVCVIGVRI